MVAVSLKKFFFQAEDGIRDIGVTGVQTCALPIWSQRLSRTAKLHCSIHLAPNYYLWANLQASEERSSGKVEWWMPDRFRKNKGISSRTTNSDASSWRKTFDIILDSVCWGSMKSLVEKSTQYTTLAKSLPTVRHGTHCSTKLVALWHGLLADWDSICCPYYAVDI